MACAHEILAASHITNIEAIFLKLDFEKAFNSVGWDFLIELLATRGFGPRCIGWIKTCLLSERSSILVNGKSGIYIHCGKDFREGDTLSPTYSFLFSTHFTKILSLADNNDNTQRIGSFPWLMDFWVFIMLMILYFLCRKILDSSSLLSPHLYFEMMTRLKKTFTNYLFITF